MLILSSRRPNRRVGALLIAAGAIFAAAPAAAKPARCVITSENRPMYTGPCEFKFDSASRGSFWVEGRSGKPLTRTIASVSVTLVDPATAEVSGSIVGGNTSRWGPATRSPKDKACWVGADFKVCAY